MRVLCHPFNCGETVGFWQTGSNVCDELQIFTCDGRSRAERSDKNFYANQELAFELFENIESILAVFFEQSVIKVLKDTHSSWYDIWEKTHHIVTKHLHRRKPHAAYGCLSEADFKWPIQIRVEEHPHAPWHRGYHANRFFAEEPYFHYFLEDGKESPEIFKRIARIDGIGKISVNPITCVGVSLIRELDMEKFWPHAHRQIMDTLMQFLREKDREVQELKRLVGV